MVSAARCTELNPLLEGAVLAGLYCPTDAQVNPFKVTQAYALAAQSAGARVLAGTRVNGIEVRAGHVCGVATSNGNVTANWVVNAAGAHADEIAAMVGVEHGVKPRRGQIVVLEATPDLPAVRVAAAGSLTAKHAGSSGGSSANVAMSYLARPLSGTVLLGSTNEFVGFDTRTTRECARRDQPLREAPHAAPWAYAGGSRMGGACGRTAPRGRCSARTAGPQGYVTAIGHGGDGVALSPITGVYVADVIAAEGKGRDITEFLRAVRGERA